MGAEELVVAYNEWQIALNNFEFAELEFVDTAIYEIQRSESRYNALLKTAKDDAKDEEAPKLVPVPGLRQENLTCAREQIQRKGVFLTEELAAIVI